MLCLVGSIANIEAMKNTPKEKNIFKAKYGKKSLIKKIIISPDTFGPISWLPGEKIITNTPKKVKFFSLNGKDVTPKKLIKHAILETIKNKETRYLLKKELEGRTKHDRIYKCKPSSKGDKIAIFTDSWPGPFIKFYNIETNLIGRDDQKNMTWLPDNKGYISRDGIYTYLQEKSIPNKIYKNILTKWDSSYKNHIFSKDGKYLIRYKYDSAEIIETKNAKLIQRKTFEFCTGIKFVNNDTIIYKEPKKDKLTIFDVKKNKTIQEIPIPTNKNLITTAHLSFDVSNNGQYIATAYRKKINIIDLKSGRILYTLVGHKKLLSQIKFSKNDQYIASKAQGFCKGSELIIWRNPAYKKQQKFKEKDFEERVNYILQIQN